VSLQVGVATLDCTPPAGLAMSGFAARTERAAGAHDAITVRALAVDETVLVTVDACGLHEDFCARVRAKVPGTVVLTATHTHGGPATVPGRLGGPVDPGYLDALHVACVAAARHARAVRESANLEVGVAADPGVARNRRRADGPVFAPLTVARFRRPDGRIAASVVSYPCHPVVLGPDNLLWTADYPGVVRGVVEAADPGSVCLFLTGCCGELNTGHSAHASMTLEGAGDRSFAAAERIGRLIGLAALAAPTRQLSDPPGAAAASGEIALPLQPADPAATATLSEGWASEMATADLGRRALLCSWEDWAREVAPRTATSWTARVTVLRWGGLRIVALPGEPFSVTARRTAELVPGECLVIGYADGSPGYLPPAEEFPYGGYEIDEAHRYYGMPAPFAPGAAESLTQLAADLAGQL
jgi:neutral ceramidase